MTFTFSPISNSLRFTIRGGTQSKSNRGGGQNSQDGDKRLAVVDKMRAVAPEVDGVATEVDEMAAEVDGVEVGVIL